MNPIKLNKLNFSFKALPTNVNLDYHCVLIRLSFMFQNK